MIINLRNHYDYKPAKNHYAKRSFFYPEKKLVAYCELTTNC